jgi:hypothetical protein
MRRWIGVLAMPLAVALSCSMLPLMTGCGVDESIKIREENYNAEMEEHMRAQGRRRDIDEELAEEEAYRQRMAEQGNP